MVVRLRLLDRLRLGPLELFPDLLLELGHVAEQAPGIDVQRLAAVVEEVVHVTGRVGLASDLATPLYGSELPPDGPVVEAGALRVVLAPIRRSAGEGREAEA